MANAIALRKRHLTAAQAVDLGVLYSSISAGMLLARRYLTGRGIDQEFADRYGSAFGRTAAKAYRQHHGVEPRRAWSLVSGKWRRVNGYLPADADILDEAYETYPRTRDYVVTTEPSPVEVYLKETAGHEARFADITGDTLRTLERGRDTEAVTDFVEERLADLDRWQRSVDRYGAAMVGDVDRAERDAIHGLPWEDSRLQAWVEAERGSEALSQARDILNAAYLDWAFDVSGTVEIPDLPRPAAPVIPEGCRIPGCSGEDHLSNTCTAHLPDVAFDGKAGIALASELLTGDDDAPHIVSFVFNMTSLDARREMRDRPATSEFTAQLRALADAIDDASAHLPAAS